MYDCADPKLFDIVHRRLNKMVMNFQRGIERIYLVYKGTSLYFFRKEQRQKIMGLNLLKIGISVIHSENSV